MILIVLLSTKLFYQMLIGSIVQLMSFWLNYCICSISDCQYLIKEINTCGCGYAFDAEKQGVVQPLHQVSNQTDP